MELREHMNESMELTVPTFDLVVAGRLDIGQEGPHQVKTSLETDEAIDAYAEHTKGFVVRAEETNTAVCIDGRGCRCLACDVSAEGQMPEYSKPPIRLKVEGGLVNAMTDAALLADWSLLTDEDKQSYEAARNKVSTFLEKEGYVDAAHTADVSFESAEGTECGAWMKKTSAMQEGARVRAAALRAGTASPLEFAVGAYNGIDGQGLLTGVDSDAQNADETNRKKRHYAAIRQSQAVLSAEDKFAFDAVSLRDKMKDGKGQHLEVLFSDPEHPTHNHKEPVLIIIDTVDPDVTIDRDAMYEQDGFAPFVDNRNFRRKLANLMGATDEEKERILIAGDVATVDVGNVLFAPGMPVLVIK